MNKKQKVILSLLQEIDEICRRNKIEYYLSPRLTLCAVEGHPFPQNPMFGVVLMKTADMERFRLAVDEDPREKRALESMKSHKWFSGFYLRYTNTDTLCLNLDNTRDYAFPGIGVNIFPLRTPAASVKAERRLSRDENAWTELCHINYADRNFRSRVNRTIMRLQCMITGRQGQAAHLYDRLVRSCQQPGANKYILKRRKQTTVSLQKFLRRVNVSPLIFISTALTHLAGGSAGREGAAIQLGGSIANQLGRWIHLDEEDRHVIVMCGMSAAFSALFGTPMAAVCFCIGGSQCRSDVLYSFDALYDCVPGCIRICGRNGSYTGDFSCSGYSEADY